MIQQQTGISEGLHNTDKYMDYKILKQCSSM